MSSLKTKKVLRKAHRYLGLFLGIQFVFWTVGGLYFSWTELDEIHGDQFRKMEAAQKAFTDLPGISIPAGEEVYNLELRNIGGEPFYWLNDHILVHAVTGERKPIISELEARKIAAMQMSPDLELLSVTYIEEVGSHHEYRGKPLPAYLLEYRDPRNITAYVSARDGKLQSIRHRSWRWFDFLWMLHTMDYQGRDNFNTALLRAFSVLGLITVGSGFGLWYVTSRRRRNLFRVFSKGNSKEKQDQ